MDNSLCMDDTTPPVTPEKYCCTQQAEPARRSRWEFFRQSRTAPDQLRAAHGARLAPDLRRRQAAACETYANAEFQQRLARRRVRHLREPAHQVRAVAAARPVPELGQERSRARRHPAEREFRARADAALHDRRQPAERRRHAEARRQRPARSRPTASPTSRRWPASSPATTIRPCPARPPTSGGNRLTTSAT